MVLKGTQRCTFGLGIRTILGDEQISFDLCVKYFQAPRRHVRRGSLRDENGATEVL